MENNVNIKNKTGFQVDVRKEKQKDKAGKIVYKVFIYIFLTAVAIFAFFPFYWMIITSLKSEGDFRQSIPSFFPDKAYGGIRWSNYRHVLLGDNNFTQVIINTLVVGIMSTGLGLIVTILTAYAFARMNFKGKNILFTLMLGTMMIPGEMFTITNYLTISDWKWQNTYIVLILPFLVSVYYIYLLRNSFMQIPETLYKAAKVDGISDMGYLVKVMVPLTAPTLISITLLKFIGTWNSYIWPRLVNLVPVREGVISKENWVLLSNWVSNGFSEIGSSEQLTTLKMAAACIASAPLFLLFVFFRKYIMHGVSKSGTKG